MSKPSCGERKVLIVRLDAIGDYIVWLDSAREIREIYARQGYKLTLLANSLWAPLAEDHGVFDEVWSLDRRKFSKDICYRLSLLNKVRAAGFEIAIQPTFSRDFLFGDTIIKASCAKERIGSETDGFNQTTTEKKRSDQWYTRLIPADRAPVMELIRNANFVRGLGSSAFKAGVPVLPVPLSSPVPSDPYYVLVPGAGSMLRQWPVSRFAELAEMIYEMTGWTGVVCGGAGERTLGEAIESATDAPIQNWAGRTSLQELVAVIKEARFVVANETSAIHIAAAVSTASVCIVGGGHFGRFVPYQLEKKHEGPLPLIAFHEMECFGCNWGCCCSGSDEVAPCIEKVTVDDVWRQVVSVIAATDAIKKVEDITSH